MSADDLRPQHRRFIILKVVGEEEARIDLETGKVFMRDDADALVESYDWARFGRIAYRALTNGKEPPGGNEHG